MAKHLVDIDEDALQTARAGLGTATIKDTVNRALLMVSDSRTVEVARGLDVLGGAQVDDREQAWR